MFLALIVEQCTATHKTIIAGFEQHLFLGIEFTVGVVVYKLDALKEFLVEGDVISMLC